MPSSVGPNTFGEENLVFGYDLGDVANSYKGQPTVNHIADLGDPTEERARGEFGQYFNLVPIFETYGLVPYTLSMEIKGNIPGYCRVYMQNGSYTKYAFISTVVDITTEWQRFVFSNLTPSGPTAAWQANTPGDNRAMLATYTIYGTGRNPVVRNVQLERSAHVTPFTAGTRSATQGLIDLKGTSTIDLTNVSFDSNAQMTFDGTDDQFTIADPNVGTTFSIEIIVKVDNYSNGPILISPNSVGIDHFFRIGNNGRITAQFVEIADSSADSYTSTTVLSTSNYYHVVISKSPSNGTIYVNGVAEDSHTPTLPAAAWTGTWKIGARQNNTFWFNGELPLMKVYNRALTAQEVRANYNAIKGRFNI